MEKPSIKMTAMIIKLERMPSTDPNERSDRGRKTVGIMLGKIRQSVGEYLV